MFYITISNGLLKDGHRKRMGEAVWEFMWLIDRVTSIDEHGYGKVLGGKPIKLDELAEDLEVHRDTISANLIKLEEQGYIEKTRTPYGLSIRVTKAKKRFGGKTEETAEEHFNKQQKKMSEDRKGEKHYNWKGGITPVNRSIRTSLEYKAWRQDVFERDKYTCVQCKRVGSELEADHIKPFSTHPELRLDISNGQTLCKACHSKKTSSDRESAFTPNLNRNIPDADSAKTPNVIKTIQYDNNNKTISKEITGGGNPEINECISYLKSKNHEMMDGTQAENRRYCWLLLQGFGYGQDKMGAAKIVKALIEAAAADSFHSKNATTFKYLYYNKAKIINSTKVSKSKVATV